MGISIALAQKRVMASGGQAADIDIASTQTVKLNTATLALFKVYGDVFLNAIAESIKKNNVSASGYLVDNIKVPIYEDGSGLSIYMPDYYNYPNKGVKGISSHKNAPNSPFQYKTYGMPKSARNSLKKYISSGRAKVTTVQKTNDKALGIGREKKGIDLMETKVNTLVYLIKKYGIKATNYFDEAIAEVQKNLTPDLLELVGLTIIVQVGKPKKK
ncbi:hypothetical protein UFOVP1384_3 [uncultured Caudovirales phage]|uniref:Uncharacterized protein n=1 Tax=uncultured Caudovirales phage TaxID=2100421 RepID=A0A6J5S5L5_9CAUD|nr:hypothetical protein UFOVP1384_3 [uncultured Caudovirales phage]